MTSLCWSIDDLKLVSCADNGSVYEWNISSGERTQEVVVKTCSFSYLTLSPDSQTIFAVGSDRTVKQISQSRIVQEIDLHSFDLSSICISNNGKVLVSGSSTGSTQLFKFPLSLPGKWKEWKIHGDLINFIKISHTNDTLVTGSYQLAAGNSLKYSLLTQPVETDPFVFGTFGRMTPPYSRSLTTTPRRYSSPRLSLKRRIF